MSQAAAAALPSSNPARAVTGAGGLLALFLVAAAALSGSGTGVTLAQDLPWMALFTAAGIVLVIAGGRVLDRVFLGSSLAAQVTRGNVAAGIVAASHRVAVGVVVARCVYGHDLPTLAVSSAFVAIAVATLLLFQSLHRRLTHYADDQEIHGENVAAALSSAGLTVALAVIVGHAASGSFAGWGPSLVAYLWSLLLALGLYPVRQIVVKRLILGFPLSFRGDALDRAIAQDRNPALGAVEGLSYLATAFLVTGLW
jgi:uncharacterized membrane protein YjfL (UPF0719 family)